MSTGTFPIVRLEVQGMQHAICVALTEYAARMDADVQAAVARACEPQRVLDIIQATAAKAVDAAIKEEIEAFFKWGDGRKAIKAAVEAQLSKRDKEW